MTKKNKSSLMNYKRKKSLKIRKRLRNQNFLRKSKEWKKNYLLVTKPWMKPWNKSKNFLKPKLLLKRKEENRSELNKSTIKWKKKRWSCKKTSVLSKKNLKWKALKSKRFNLNSDRLKENLTICKMSSTEKEKTWWTESGN